MELSDKGLALIKEFEGFRADAYKCPAGVWTIGYGHTQGVKEGQTVTEAQAAALLRQDTQEAQNAVKKLAAYRTQAQFDALVSLVFNIGYGNFYNSTIRRLLNEGCRNADQLGRAWKMWQRGGGRVLMGLVRRRDAEFRLFVSEGLE